MKKEFVLRILLVLVMIFSAFAIPPNWEYLGSRKINKDFDKDKIYITASEGSFNALKIKVLHRPMTLYNMKVHYGNGSVQDIKVKVHIPAGGESRVIDLAGTNRVIEKVVFRYETKGNHGKRAKILLFGRH